MPGVTRAPTSFIKGTVKGVGRMLLRRSPPAPVFQIADGTGAAVNELLPATNYVPLEGVAVPCGWNAAWT